MRTHVRLRLIAPAAVALLAIVAGCATEFKPDASTPKDAVRTYLGFLARGDFEAAYALLGRDAQARCDKTSFLDRAAYAAQELEMSRVVVRDTNVFDSRASVRASVDPGRVDVGPLGPRSSSFDATYSLVLEGAGWRLSDTGWPYVFCDIEQRKPAEPTATPTPTPAATAAPAGKR